MMLGRVAFKTYCHPAAWSALRDQSFSHSVYSLISRARRDGVIWISADADLQRNQINFELLKKLSPIAATQPVLNLGNHAQRQEGVMILGLSPTLDLRYDDIQGNVNLDAGGKSYNHWRACQLLNLQHTFVGFSSRGLTGQKLLELSTPAGIAPANVHLVNLNDEVRIVFVYNDEILKAPGPKISQSDLTAVLEKLEKQIVDTDWLILGGSLPLGVSPEVILGLVSKYGGKNKIIIDSADMWGAGLIGDHPPFFLKPNMREFVSLANKYYPDDAKEISEDSFPTDQAVVALARRFVKEHGISILVVTKDADHFIVVTKEQTFVVTPPKVKLCGGLGCGDAFTIGMLDILTRHSIGVDGAGLTKEILVEAMRQSSSFAAASATYPGTGFAADLTLIESLKPFVQVQIIT